MKVLIDMNLSPRWTAILAQAGFEAIHWSKIGPGNAPDRTLFDYAAQHGYVILTHDLDFGAILAAGGETKPSVVQMRGFDLRPEATKSQVLAALNQTALELQAGALVTVDTQRTRVRILPL
jgi:predicted nuclease of predicted toxin-antitoxin system